MGSQRKSNEMERGGKTGEGRKGHETGCGEKKKKKMERVQ